MSQPSTDDVAAQNADQFVEAVSAAMPPSKERHQRVSADELLQELNRVPLFMTSLDETDGEGGENMLLEAIKAIAFEGTPLEVATNFREQGNEAARTKLWKDAREFYTKAIQAVRGQVKTTSAEGEAQPRVEEIEDPAEEAKKMRALEEACLTNRALCNLEMKNYGATNRDAAAALRLNPKNIKAWYRAASACFALDKLPEALDACTSGLSFDPANASLLALNKKIESRTSHLASLESARLAREQAAQTKESILRTALTARGIPPIRKTDSPPEMEDAEISLVDPADPSSRLQFPVLFLYPLHAQTDFVKAVNELETLGHHLEYLLPVPWDEKGEYATKEEVECYMETKGGGLIKAGKKLEIVKLLGSGKVEVVDGLVRVFVVPSKRAKEWIEEFKKRRGKN
ncbi:unnamed protein product [Zymoseptoria tritici ST99CH_3D1]|nr:unnamed protein product [Zymoseptoria tritici ST99CH_3D1]